MLGLKTDLIVPLLVNAVQELKREKDAENSRLLSLSKQAENRASAAEARAEKLELELATLRQAQGATAQRLAKFEKMEARLSMIEAKMHYARK